MRWFRKSSSGGFTFIELLVVTGVVMVLASAALPLTRVSMKRQREADLRLALKEIRTAIDSFKDFADRGAIAQTELSLGGENYPRNLDVLVEGVLLANDATGRKKKFLRRIPIDPMTGTADWGKRAYQDSPDSRAWGGQSVFDVFTKSDAKALNGGKYKDW